MKLIRSLYDWVLKFTHTPYAGLALFLMAIVEAIFFPIPPDVLLVAMAVAIPTRAFKYALVCAAGSVIGGSIGYVMGAEFMELLGMPILKFYHATEHFDKLKSVYQENAVVAIAAAGFSPIPYKVFTLSSGAFDVPFFTFVVTSAISRSARFFLVAGFIYIFGARIQRFIDKYFNILTLAFTALLILGFVVIKYLS